MTEQYPPGTPAQTPPRAPESPGAQDAGAANNDSTGDKQQPGPGLDRGTQLILHRLDGIVSGVHLMGRAIVYQAQQISLLLGYLRERRSPSPPFSQNTTQGSVPLTRGGPARRR
ncbi:uncharacterized protein O3C94_004931 [Discoglossus pictus]